MEASLNQWFSGQEIKAICWTLIHSLWIGLIIALLCGIVIGATRKSAAALRYRLLCGLLVLFVCAIGATYYLETSATPASPALAAAPAGAVSVQHNIVINPVAAPQHQTLLDNLKVFLNENISIIFLVWLLFFMLKSLKMVSGLLYIQRIRNYKILEVAEELKHKIENFSSQIGIGRAVSLVQSELVKVPVAVGWLKPMILLPMGIAFQLTPEQLDGILWHELAHIRRRDYLVNILQGLLETVFFFNPGLLWLSSLIRTEREACCDDMVLSRMNRKANYLEALLSFGYGEFSQARYAMSIGSGNQLRDRLKRMISQENKRLGVAEKSVLAIGLVLLCAFTTISKSDPLVKHLTVKFAGESGKVITKMVSVSIRPLPAGQRVNDSKPGAHGNDTLLVKDTVTRFTSVLFKNSDAEWANNDISAKDDKGNIYHMVVVDSKIASMEINGVKVEENKLSDYQYLLGLIVSELNEKRHYRSADLAAFKARQPEARLQAMKRRRMGDSLRVDKLPADSKYSADALPEAKLRFEKLPVYPKYSADALPEAKMKEMNMRQRMQDENVGYQRELKRMMDIIADLVKDKVVANAADVKWFGLSNTEFIVNGQKQSNEMQQRYKAKYGVHEDYGLYYGPVQMQGRGVFIDAADMAPRSPRPQRPQGPKMGAVPTYSSDSTMVKQQELIRQQQLFIAKEDAKRRRMIENQAHIIAQQQHFTNQQTKEYIKQEQAHQTTFKRDYLAEQDAKRADMMRQQQQYLADQNDRLKQFKQLHPGIDLKTPITGIIADLVSENIISDKNDLVKFNLTNAALMVNGKKQSEDIHEKLKAKYLDQPNYLDKFKIADDPNFGLHFNAQNGNMGLGVTDGPDSP